MSGIFLAALGELRHRQPLWLAAMFIVGGSGAPAGVDSATGLRRPWRGKEESVVRSWAVWRPSPPVFCRLAPPYHPERLIDAGFPSADWWAGLSMCLRRLPRSPKRVACRSSSCATGLLGIMLVFFVCYDSRLPGDALAAERLGRRGALDGFLYSHEWFHCAHLEGLLPRERK